MGDCRMPAKRSSGEQGLLRMCYRMSQEQHKFVDEITFLVTDPSCHCWVSGNLNFGLVFNPWYCWNPWTWTKPDYFFLWTPWLWIGPNFYFLWTLWLWIEPPLDSQDVVWSWGALSSFYTWTGWLQPLVGLGQYTLFPQPVSFCPLTPLCPARVCHVTWGSCGWLCLCQPSAGRD